MIFDQLKDRIRNILVARVSFESVWPASRRTVFLEPERVATPECMELPLMREARYLRAPYVESPAAWWALIEGALYYTGAAPNDVILARRGMIVTESDNIHLEVVGAHPAWSYAWRPMYFRRAHRVPGCCILLRSPASNYYHTLVDNLPRLMALHDPALSDRSVSVIVPGSLKPFEAWFLDRMLPPHAKVVLVPSEALYRPDELVFASYVSRQMCGFLPRGFTDFLNERVRPRRPSRRNRRIYISRVATKWKKESKGRRIVNEAAVTKLLVSHGFERLILERLPLEAQIDAMHDATAIVAPHGAGLTNLLFCDDVDVIELHPCQEILPHYYFLSKARGNRYQYVCGHEGERNDNFEVDLATLELALSRLA